MLPKVGVWTLVVWCLLHGAPNVGAQSDLQGYYEADSVSGVHEPVKPKILRRVYEQVKTPHKYGVVLKGKPGTKVDSPSIFRYEDRWYMMYIIYDGQGYETAVARSKDLLHWKPLGKILRFQPSSWDANQAAGYISLQKHRWTGDWTLQTYRNRYWLSYLGGADKGYEKGTLGVGIAWTKDPSAPFPWKRLENNPVLSPNDADTRRFEDEKLYKSHIIYDKEQTLGYPFVMYYNAKGKHESIGMAVSKDMVHWQRYGKKPVLDNGSGISGDPQVVRMGDLWVMFYFGAFWKPKAFDTFAVSRDLVHWTKWKGPHLVEPSKPWDRKYAHKPWVVRHKGIVYHFYCAVGEQGRVIALATSKDLQDKRSEK